MLLFIRSKSRDSMIYFWSNTTILFVNTILLFINTTGGMKNLPVVLFIPSIEIKIMILVLLDKLLVLFDRSIRIPRAHARIHKVFYPCNHCHLATLLENQRVTCGNEVTRVTRKGDFALNIHSTQLLCLPNYCMWVAKPWASRVEGAASRGRRCRLRGSKPGAPWVEGTGFMPLGDYP